MFDANSNEVYDNKTVEQLTKIWDDMGLDVGNEQMKQAFLNGKKAEYNAYWQYKSRQPEGEEPKFEFTAAEREALLNKELTESGMGALDAHFTVSRLLGHERPDVTNIYLASVRKGERHEQ